ncbi:hypothetical protein B0H13DRAFT_2389828, partial [Mycena leptocephala]
MTYKSSLNARLSFPLAPPPPPLPSPAMSQDNEFYSFEEIETFFSHSLCRDLTKFLVKFNNEPLDTAEKNNAKRLVTKAQPVMRCIRALSDATNLSRQSLALYLQYNNLLCAIGEIPGEWAKTMLEEEDFNKFPDSLSPTYELVKTNISALPSSYCRPVPHEDELDLASNDLEVHFPNTFFVNDDDASNKSPTPTPAPSPSPAPSIPAIVTTTPESGRTRASKRKIAEVQDVSPTMEDDGEPEVDPPSPKREKGKQGTKVSSARSSSSPSKGKVGKTSMKDLDTRAIRKAIETCIKQLTDDKLKNRKANPNGLELNLDLGDDNPFMYVIRKPTTGGSKAFSALPPKSIVRIGNAARARSGVELPPVELKEVEELALEEAAIPDYSCFACIARRADCVPVGYGLACLGCASQRQSTCDHKFTAEQVMNVYSEIGSQVPSLQLKDAFREAQAAVKSAAQARELADSLAFIANE